MMAKKRTIVEETIPDTPQTEDVPKIVAWSKIKVFKVVPGLSQRQFCFSRNTDVDEEALQASSYGGGRYEVDYLDADGITVQTITQEIAALPVTQQPSTPESIQIQMLREQSQMNRDLLMAVLGTGNNRAQTPMSELAQMWGVMHGTGNGSNGATSMIDVFIKGLEMAHRA